MLPAIIAGGAALAGAYMNAQAHESASARAAALNRENTATQREFAQQGIRWKVEDARQAGINPLVALGAQTHSFAPSSIDPGPDYSMGNALSSMGQDVSRAMIAKATPEEQTLAKMQIQSAQLDLEGKSLDNQLRASQLQKLNSAPPPLPSAMSALIPGQGNAYNVTPADIIASDPSDPSRQAGAINDYQLAASSHGGLIPVPSKDMKAATEDNMFQEIPWAIRNNLLTNYGFRHKGVPDDYRWNPLRQQYEKGYSGIEGIHQLHPLYWAYRGYKKWKGGK